MSYTFSVITETGDRETISHMLLNSLSSHEPRQETLFQKYPLLSWEICAQEM